MSEQDNIRIAQSFYDAWNSGDLSKNDHLVADDFMTDAPGSAAPQNREQARQYNQGFLTAFPGSRFEIVRTIAQGDMVVTEWRASGVHSGPLVTPSGGTIPPTGKMVTIVGSTTTQIKNGKAQRGWTYWDMTSMLIQIGMMPAM